MPPLASRQRRELLSLLLFNSLVAVVLFLAHNSQIIVYWENAFVDLRYTIRGMTPPDPRIVIVEIDESSIKEMGLFPWPRERHAQFIDLLTRARAKAIAFDVLFTERDLDHPEDDALLGDAADKSGRVIFSMLFNRGPDGTPAEPLAPVEPLQKDNVNFGFVNIFPEFGGASRHYPLWVKHNGAVIPSLAFAAWSVAEGRLPEELVDRARPAVDSSTPWNEAYLNYTYWRDGPERSPFPAYPYVDVLRGRVDPAVFSGKIVLIGATAAGLFDAKSAPGAPVISGIEIHANALNNLLKNNFFKTSWTSGGWLLLIMVFFGVGSGLLMSRSSSFIGGAAVVAVILGYFSVCQFFFNRHILLAFTSPILSFIITFLITLGYNLFIADREKLKMQTTWSRYMSPKLVDLLIQDQAVLTAGNREVTVFFSDLVKFTSLSEQFPPKELVELLNVYFSVMTDILFKYDLTFDKYIGDCIMAYGNAPFEQPGHALAACRAALEQVAALPSLHKKFADRRWPPIDFRIGIHTGTVLYGDLGSYTRSNYTVMGDTVNLASRLEGVNKMFGTRILISESTFQAAQAEIEARELDFIRVEGKKQPIRVYELAARKNALSPEKRQAFAVFADALRLYRERRFKDAQAEFLRVATLVPNDQPAAVYFKRCEQFLRTEPPRDWDGVFVMTSK